MTQDAFIYRILRKRRWVKEYDFLAQADREGVDLYDIITRAMVLGLHVITDKKDDRRG